MCDRTMLKIRNLVGFSWLISLAYFIFIIKDFEGRYASELPFADKVFCWIFILHTFTLAEVILLSARGIKRTPRTIFITLFVLIAYSILRLTK